MDVPSKVLKDRSISILPADTGRGTVVQHFWLPGLNIHMIEWHCHMWDPEEGPDQHIQKDHRLPPTIWKRGGNQSSILPQTVSKGSHSMFIRTSQIPQNRNTSQTHRQQQKHDDLWYCKTSCSYFNSSCWKNITENYMDLANKVTTWRERRNSWIFLCHFTFHSHER